MIIYYITTKDETGRIVGEPWVGYRTKEEAEKEAKRQAAKYKEATISKDWTAEVSKLVV